MFRLLWEQNEMCDDHLAWLSFLSDMNYHDIKASSS